MNPRLALVPALVCALACSGLGGSESPADLANPISHEATAWRVTYPGNWSLDTSKHDYNPNTSISIDTAGESFLSIDYIEGHADPAENLQIMVDELSKLIDSPSRTPFTSWGKLQGQGAELRGTMFSILRASARIFCWSDPDRSLIVVEFTYDDDEPATRPGFDLVARTFALK